MCIEQYDTNATVSKNSNIKKTIYKSASMTSTSDLATRQMQACYVAAHHTIKTKQKKNIQTIATFTKAYVNT